MPRRQSMIVVISARLGSSGQSGGLQDIMCSHDDGRCADHQPQRVARESSDQKGSLIETDCGPAPFMWQLPHYLTPPKDQI
jgi:hypothetical protein